MTQRELLVPLLIGYAIGAATWYSYFEIRDQIRSNDRAMALALIKQVEATCQFMGKP